MGNLVWRNTLMNEATGQSLYEGETHIKNPYDDATNTYKLWTRKVVTKMCMPCYRANLRELGILSLLSFHLIQGNLIGKKTNKGNVACGMADIAKIIGTTEKEAREFIGSMKKKRIIAKQGKAFIVNPAFFIRSGQEITGFMWQTFKDDLKNVIPASVQKEFEMRE